MYHTVNDRLLQGRRKPCKILRTAADQCLQIINGLRGIQSDVQNGCSNQRITQRGRTDTIPRRHTAATDNFQASGKPFKIALVRFFVKSCGIVFTDLCKALKLFSPPQARYSTL